MITSDFWVQFKATLDSEAFWDTLDVTADIEQSAFETLGTMESKGVGVGLFPRALHRFRVNDRFGRIRKSATGRLRPVESKSSRRSACFAASRRRKRLIDLPGCGCSRRPHRLCQQRP